jgi:ABC-type lipoprotein export system ATPase subunit
MTALGLGRPAVLACQGVGVVHGTGPRGTRALAEVDLEISEGDRVALLGRSGSGKTTLLHVLGGLLEPTEGVVERLGEDETDGARRAVGRPGVGQVFQSPNLLPWFTAYENVAFAARVAGDAGDAATARVVELLALVGLEPKLDHLPSELSGGEAQRVAIARAIAQRPRALLCDEPTGHLDSDTGERVLDLIEAAQAEFRFTLVLATHDSDVVARFPRAVELADGSVVSAGAFA